MSYFSSLFYISLLVSIDFTYITKEKSQKKKSKVLDQIWKERTDSDYIRTRANKHKYSTSRVKWRNDFSMDLSLSVSSFIIWCNLFWVSINSLKSVYRLICRPSNYHQMREEFEFDLSFTFILVEKISKISRISWMVFPVPHIQICFICILTALVEHRQSTKA